MTTKTVTLKLRPPLDLIEPIRVQARAEGTIPRVIIERAVIQYIQCGCPSLMSRLTRKADLDRRSSPRERRIAMAVRRATTERRGTPRKHPLPPDEQAEVDRRVAEWHKANPSKPPPKYKTASQNSPKKPEEKKSQKLKNENENDFSEITDEEPDMSDTDDLMKLF